MADAILREKRIKKWRRTWKLELIERHNRQWRDLYEELGESARPLFMPRQALGPRLRRGDEQGGVPHANFRNEVLALEDIAIQRMSRGMSRARGT